MKKLNAIKFIVALIKIISICYNSINHAYDNYFDFDIKLVFCYHSRSE